MSDKKESAREAIEKLVDQFRRLFTMAEDLRQKMNDIAVQIEKHRLDSNSSGEIETLPQAPSPDDANSP